MLTKKIDTAEVEEEDWIEYMKRSTDEAMQRMKTAIMQCCITARRRMKWRRAMRIASLAEEIWAAKAAGWNPELSMKCKTWEDEVTDFLWMDQDSKGSKGMDENGKQDRAPNTRGEGERVIGTTPAVDMMQSWKLPDSYQHSDCYWKKWTRDW